MNDGPSDIPRTANPSAPEDGVGPAADETATPAARPSTGDRAVDDALAAFDRALSDGPAAQAEAAAAAHRALQSRLTTPATPPPAAPGEARPGPSR